MKRFLAMIMAFVMMFSLCACSSGEESEEQKSGTKEEQKNEAIVPERGTVENGVYKNEGFGISFTADENWYYYTDEEIAATMGVAEDQILSPEDKEAIENAGFIYDMYCADNTTGGSVNVSFENVSAVYGDAMDLEYYLELTQTQIDDQFNGIESINVIKNESGYASVDGKMYPCVNVIVDFGGVSIYETIIVKKCGGWMGVVTIASLDEVELSGLVKKVSFE